MRELKYKELSLSPIMEDLRELRLGSSDKKSKDDFGLNMALEPVLPKRDEEQESAESKQSKQPSECHPTKLDFDVELQPLVFDESEQHSE